MSVLIKEAAMLLLILAVASCASMPKQSAGKMAAGGQEEDYIFGPDDIIRVLVEDHPEWSGDFIVKPDGAVVIPNYGEVKVSGTNRAAVQQTLTKGMSTYLNNPKVSVEAVRYVSQVIYVFGQVNRPGEYPTAGKRITLKDAIIQAGLPSLYAVTTRVYVISPAEKRPAQKVINLERILYHGETERNVVLHPGDIVFVPKSLLGRIADFFGSILGPITTNSALRVTNGAIAVQ